MAGVTKVNGTTEVGQFFGREILSINIDTLVAAPAAVDGVITWPELDLAIQAIETICTVSLIGAFTTGDTEVNVLVEGHDYNDNAGEIVRLDALVASVTVGGGVTENAL